MFSKPQASRQLIELSERGGRVTRWAVNGEDIFFPQQEMVIDGIPKLRGGMFPCFPNFGRVDPRFGLPQHGPLRELMGTKTIERDRQRVFFEGSNILDSAQVPAKVAVDVDPSMTNHREFTYTLRAAIPQGKIVPTNAALHPFFRTPQGKATIFYKRQTFKVEGLINESRQLPFSRRVLITIPGLGLIEMNPLDQFCAWPFAYFNLWRDSLEYFCLEPVLARPRAYGGNECPQIHGSNSGWSFRIGCSFEFKG